MISVGFYIGAACVLLAIAALLFIFNVQLDSSDYTPHRTKASISFSSAAMLSTTIFATSASNIAPENIRKKITRKSSRSAEIGSRSVLASKWTTLTGSTPTPATRQAATERVRNS